MFVRLNIKLPNENLIPDIYTHAIPCHHFCAVQSRS
jgi:hypothetical protein